MHFQHFMPGQLIALNEEISDAQAQGYGLACEDPRGKLNCGTVYEVSGIDVRRWASRVYVLGVEGRFNSACFHAVS